jgi:bifunctional ADP-heptose synthase (sugar kinase/adenylyltransferase)
MAINVYDNLKALGIDCDIITSSGTTKTRYVDEVSNQMLLRIDENDESEELCIEKLQNINFNKYYAIVISDYNKGFLSEDIIQYIANKHQLVFLDSKKKIGNWCLNIEVIKINEKEFNENSEFLLKEYNGELIVTHGKEGASIWFNQFPIEEEHEVRDLSGAGDTFLAALVADIIKNNDIHGAIKFANKCASWAVTQKGVVVIDLNKIL